MLLTSDPSGEWFQIVAANGIDSVFIHADDAALTLKNLPPITGYDAWSTFDPNAYYTVPSESVDAPLQTDPPVAATSTTVTTSTTAPTSAPTEPSAVQPDKDTSESADNGYTSSFGSDWVQYAAYALLGVLAVAFVVILFSLIGKKCESENDNYDNYM